MELLQVLTRDILGIREDAALLFGGLSYTSWDLKSHSLKLREEIGDAT